MLTQRQLMIIFIFWNHESQTSMELSQSLHVSERTIKHDIKSMQTDAEQYGFSICSKHGTGYQFNILDDAAFSRHILVHIASYAEVNEIPDEKGKNIHEILSLLFKELWVTSGEIGACLFINKRALDAALQEIRKILQTYHLSLNSRPYYGYSIQGNELHKRFCIMDVYAHYHHMPFLIQKDMLYQTFFIMEESKQKAIRHTWLNFMRKQSCMVQDIYLEKFVYHMILSVHRSRKGYSIVFSREEQEEIQSMKSYRMVQELKKELHASGLLDFEDSEVCYLSIVLLCYIDVHRMEDIASSSYFYEMSMLCREDILHFFQQHYSAFSFTLEFQRLLLFSLFPLVVRMHYRLYEENTWLRNWRYKNIYMSPVSLEFAFLSIKRIMRQSQNGISRDAIAQLAFAYQMDLEAHMYPCRPKKLLIIPSSGYASAQPLVQIVKQYFSNCIQSIAIRERYSIKDMADIEQYNILISNPEYCQDFEGHIAFLYDSVIMEHRYQEMQDLLMGISGQIENFLPEKITCRKAVNATSVAEALASVFSPAKAVSETQFFRDREDYIFDFGLHPCAVHTHFVDDRTDEQFCIVELREPIVWHRISIDTLLICLFSPDSLLKCRFYDNFLKRLLKDETALSDLSSQCGKETIIRIMKQAG